MAHYAYIQNNTVVDVITGRDETDLEGLPDGMRSWEDYYSARRGMTCLRCSYNANIRGIYPSIGDTYDPTIDEFVPPPEPEPEP